MGGDRWGAGWQVERNEMLKKMQEVRNRRTLPPTIMPVAI
jgi:hypothetical protein